MILLNLNITIFQKTVSSQKKKDPCGKMHTRQNIFTHFFSKKKAPAGKCRHDKKMFYGFFSFFSWRKFSMYHKFSHLTTIFFIGKNSYFSYTIFFSHHNRIFSHHSRVFSHHNRVLSKHNRVLSKHNRVLLKHNRVLLKHKRAKIRGKWSDSS